MNSKTTTAGDVERDERWLFRVGGIASLAIGATYIVIIALYDPRACRRRGAKPE